MVLTAIEGYIINGIKSCRRRVRLPGCSPFVFYNSLILWLLFFFIVEEVSQKASMHLVRFTFLTFSGQQENFDVHLRGANIAHTEVNSTSLTAITFCLWVATKSSLLVEYNVTLDEEQFRGFGLVSHSKVELIFMENKTR